MFRVLHDVFDAGRTLRRAPGFCAIALTTLTVTLTANTIIFSLLNAVARPELPYRSPDRLVSISESYAPYGWTDTPLSLATTSDLDRRGAGFDGVAAHLQRRVSIADGQTRATRVQAAVITANLWDVLGVRPVLGRAFVPEEDFPAAAPAVMLGHRIWRDHFQLEPAVLGRTIFVDGEPRTVVGVMPEGFRYPESEDVWLPLGALRADERAENRAARGWRAVGRLAEGVALDASRAELTALSQRLAADHPATQAGWTLNAVLLTRDSLVATGSFFGSIQAGALLLLLMMCANLGNLLLARAERRSRELAIRRSLGATRPRIVLSLLLEPVLLSLVGAAAALMLSYWALGFASRVIPESVPFFIRFRVDAVVVSFTFGVALLAALAAGLGSALRGPGGTLAAVLSTGSGTSTAAPRAGWLRAGFLFAQTAIAAALLASTLVVASGLRQFERMDLGFDPAHLLTIDLPLSDRQAASEPVPLLAQRIVTAFEGSPDVDVAAVASPVRFSGGEGASIEVGGSAVVIRTVDTGVAALGVTRWFFEAAGIRVLQGTTFTDRHTAGGEHAVIINREAARLLFGEAAPIGARVRFGTNGSPATWYTVAGVVSDVVQQPLDPEITPRIYLPLERQSGTQLIVTLRTHTDPERLAAGASRILGAVVPLIAHETPIAGDRRLHTAVWPLRFFNGFAAALAVFGTLVACTGVYGLTRYVTSARTRETGIRLALGASPRRIATVLACSSGWPVLAGLLAGLCGAIPVTASLQRLVVGVPPFDPAVFGIAAFVLFSAGACAVALPAWRAATIEPLHALRGD